MKSEKQPKTMKQHTIATSWRLYREAMIGHSPQLLPIPQPRNGILGFLDERGLTEHGQTIRRHQERRITQLHIRRARQIMAMKIKNATEDPRRAYSLVTESSDAIYANRSIREKTSLKPDEARRFVSFAIDYCRALLRPKKPAGWPYVW